MTEKKINISTTLQILQLVILIIGVAGFFSDIGRQAEIIQRTANDLNELKSIVQDLLKSQINIATNDTRHEVLLENLQFRVTQLERIQ